MTVRVVVLDDDPTGTQCTSGVRVALNPDPVALAAFDDAVLYVLTNTRAMDADAAAATVRSVHEEFQARTDLPAVFVLRGDSTLRGHIAPEMHELGLSRGVGLVVPAYPAAGRVTVGGVHYLQTDGIRSNVADTEFASDPVFGFSARTMAELLMQKGVTTDVVGLDSTQLRRVGPAAVTDSLRRARVGAVVVPDVETDADIAIVAAGFWQAVDAGVAVITRCAAPLAAAIAKRPGRILEPETVMAERILVVCGSHTTAASRQLQKLAGGRFPVRSLSTVELLGGDPTATNLAVEKTVAAVGADLTACNLAILATERERHAFHDTLEHGARIMDGLIAAVAALSSHVDVIVSKGGITSAEVATGGLHGISALVRGQILTGVSLFDVRQATGRVVPQVVVPGNVGDDDTLSTICRFLGRR